jgi:Flp pilus assembly protein TadG
MMPSRSLPVAVEVTPAHVRKRRQRGSQIVEYTLAFIPMLMFIFLILDVAWTIYVRATLQYAVQQGLRYAVTSQTGKSSTGVVLGQIDSIRTVVQNSSFGRLKSTAGWNSIQVHCYLPDGTDVTAVVGGCGEQNGVYPLVEVSVESFSQKTFMPSISLPGMGTLGPITMSARAWDRMEAPPLTGVPSATNP